MKEEIIVPSSWYCLAIKGVNISKALHTSFVPGPVLMLFLCPLQSLVRNLLSSSSIFIESILLLISIFVCLTQLYVFSGSFTSSYKHLCLFPSDVLQIEVRGKATKGSSHVMSHCFLQRNHENSLFTTLLVYYYISV